MIWRLMILLMIPCCVLAQQGIGPLNPISWTLAAPGEAKAGAQIKAKVTARIADGWHLYSLKKQDDGPIPTSIDLPAAQDFRLNGLIDAPGPLTQRDELFGIDVEYYLGEVSFVVPVVVSKESKPGPQKLLVTARYQACDNLQCLPPRTVRLEQTVMIKDK